MNGKDLIYNIIDELIRTRELIFENNQHSQDYINELKNDIDIDLSRFYDVEDSIVAMLEDIEI